MFFKFSNFEISIDKVFLFLMGIAFLFLLGIITAMIVYAIRYSRKRLKKALQFNYKLSVEIIWIIFPILLVGLMYYYGYKNFI